MVKNEREQGLVLQSFLFQQMTEIDHFCTTRDYHNSDKGVWMPRQVHGTMIVNVNSMTDEVVEADAVITNQRGLWIGVRTADCVPVLLCDVTSGVVAAVHAGWRGTVNHIVAKTVRQMVRDFGCRPEAISAMIGPSISPERFEVGEEVADAFVNSGREDCVLRNILGRPLTKPHVDLWQSNVMDLEEEGIQLDKIDCTPLCTFDNQDLVFSARREGINTGRIVSAICFKC